MLLTGIHTARRDEQATAHHSSQRSKEAWLRSESIQCSKGPSLRVGNHPEDHSWTFIRAQEPYQATDQGKIKLK